MSRELRRTTEPPPALARNALIPLSIVGCFVLVYVVHAPPYWVFPIGLGVMALYLAAPVLGRRSMARFDRDLVQLLASGKKRGLRARYRRAIAMRLLAPPALVAERRGLVLAESGDAERARAAYRAAHEDYPEDGAPLAVRLGLAHASYALGDDDEAIRSYRAVLRDTTALPRVKTNLAHALARAGRDLGEAERLADELVRAAGDSPSPELRLLRALVHARRGQKGPARKILAATKDDGDATSHLREEVRAALEASAPDASISRPSA